MQDICVKDAHSPYNITSSMAPSYTSVPGNNPRHQKVCPIKKKINVYRRLELN